MGLRDFLFGSNQPEDLEQAFATGEIDAETYQEGLQAKAKAEAKAQAEKQKALEEAQQSRSLQANAKPSTHAESSGSANATYFQSQDLGPSELDEIRDMRESGGIISEWVHARALLEFGTGAEFESEEDRLAEWLNDNLHNLDNLLISLGEDAIYYPRSYTEIVETRGGDFSHIECIEPWTMTPETDEFGEITRFTQVIDNKEVGTYQPEEIGYYILNKSSGRDKLGISQVYRAKDEIETYLDNKKSVANAIELAGFPHVHWQVGAEDSMIINDNELRRVRNIVGNMDSDSQIVTGTDVEHEVMQPTTFDFTEILTHDSRQVATALGVPAEIATVISEGLGSGEQSKFRRRWFESQTKADRRMLSGQFIEQVAKPILIEYGGFSERLVSESNIHIEFGPIFEEDNTSDMLNQIGEDLTVNERRSAYGKEPVDDDEVGESYDTARGETTDAEQQGGGLFGSAGDTNFRDLAVPDNAVNINDPSEAPEDAQIVTGDRGGLYYIPGGGGGSGGSSSVEEFANGEQPRANIDGVNEAAEFVEEFDEGDFEYNHWGGGFEDISEGSVVEIWTGEMGFEDENALVIDQVDEETFTVVNADGEEKTLTTGLDTMDFDHTSEAPLSSVWDDEENRGDANTEPEIETESVEDEPNWIDETDFEEEFGARVETDFVSGMSLDINGEIQTLEEGTQARSQDYYQTENGLIVSNIGGVTTRVNEASNIDTGQTQFIHWSDGADMEDGWYSIDDDIQDRGGDLIVEMVDEDGETHEVDGVAVEQDGLIERKHTPIEAEEIEPELQGMHNDFDGSYPESPTLPENVQVDNISDDLSGDQQRQIERGLSKAAENGYTDEVESVEPLDVGGEAAGETLARFEPETNTIKINTERMSQETLDGLGDDFGVGDTVEDMVIHETIHAAHAASLEKQGWTPDEMRDQLLRSDLDNSEKELMESEISEYGAANPLEVVAEVGTKITRGEEVSDQALHIYEKYGGPEL